MSMEYEVVLTPQAIDQIRQVTQYMAEALLARETAKRWAAALKSEIAKLCFLPSRFPPVTEEPWRSRGIRRMNVKNFLVYYYVDEDAQQVFVTAVIYGRRDQLSALMNME